MSAFSERMDSIKVKLKDLRDKIQESDAYQQIKTKYDELDGQTKLYVNLGAVGGVALVILISVLAGISKVNGLKSEIDDREALIGYLQNSADTIKQLRAQTQNDLNADAATPLNAWAEGILSTSNIDKSRVEIGAERPGAEEKESKEILLDLKLSQVNLRQITRLLFNLTEQGKARSLNVKDLNIDTKGDPTGYMDATVTIATYRAK